VVVKPFTLSVLIRSNQNNVNKEHKLCVCVSGGMLLSGARSKCTAGPAKFIHKELIIIHSSYPMSFQESMFLQLIVSFFFYTEG